MLTTGIAVFYAIIQYIILISIGVFLRKTNFVPSDFFAQLSKFLIKLVLPAYFFTKIGSNGSVGIAELWYMPLLPFPLLATSCFLGYLFFSLLAFKGHDLRTATAVAGFGNIGYVPLMNIEFLALAVPIIDAVFGVTVPAMYVGAFLLTASTSLWSFGYFLISGHTRSMKITDFLTPPVIGIILGLAVSLTGLKRLILSDTLPFLYVFNALGLLGKTVLPLALIVLGGTIGDVKLNRENRAKLWKVAVGSSAIRMLIMPLLFHYIVHPLLISFKALPALVWVLFLETHTPPATNLSIMARNSGNNEEMVGFSLFINYVVYLLVLPFWLLLFLKNSGLQ